MPVGYGAMNFGGGFLQGLAQAKQDKYARERQDRIDKMNEKLMTLSLQDKKLKQEQMKLANALYSQFFSGQQPPGQQQTPAPAQAQPAAQIPAQGQQGQAFFPPQAPAAPDMPQMSPRIPGAEQQQGVAGTIATRRISDLLKSPEIAKALDFATGGQLGLFDIYQQMQREKQWEAGHGLDVANFIAKIGKGEKVSFVGPDGTQYLAFADPRSGQIKTEPIRTGMPPVKTVREKLPSGEMIEREINPYTGQPYAMTPAAAPQQAQGAPTPTQPRGVPAGARVVETKKPLPVDTAAKLSMAQAGLQSIDQVVQELFQYDEQGNIVDVDRGIVAQMQNLGFTKGMPFTRGRMLRQRLDDALETKIRIESGAAVPDSEIARLLQRFLPSMLDSDESIIDKMKRLKSFMSGVITKLDPGKQYPSGTESFADEQGNLYAVVPKKNFTMKELDDIAQGKGK